MIDTLLIANRGEIARRIMRTCRGMGIRTIAVYSDADAESPAVREADLALRVGPAPAAESYLDGEAILALAEGNGAQAIHPGYGFLSENAGFSARCAERGVIFVGAPPEAIRAMGDKGEAKGIMEAAGVAVLPGTRGEAQDPETLTREAERIGYPLLVKAVAGGGGRGIRLVESAGALAEAVESARREAESGFGDGRLMLEKFLAAPRHVEFQVLGDRHGNAVHLFERECSVQRRHQKIVEESPSPALDATLREAMGAAAVRAAQAIGYVGAGTVEFLLDESGEYYFLEMNTRLQVEHPVTEMTLGLDLVRLQIEVAEGRPLPVTQAELQPRGHAIECRLNAEDPARNFLPAVGRLRRFEFPEGAGLRVDSGFEDGSEITPHYDSLLAKLIAWGETREEALRKARRLLADSFVSGIPTNLPYLQWVLGHPGFAAGEYTTRLVEDGAADWSEFAESGDAGEVLLAAAALEAHLAATAGAVAMHRNPNGHRGSPWDARTPWLAAGAPVGQLRRIFGWAGERHAVTVRPESDGELTVEIEGLEQTVRFIPNGPGEAALDLGTVRLPLRWDAEGTRRWLSFRGRHFFLTAEDPAKLSAGARVGDPLEHLRAPLPGTVVQVAAQPGQAVRPGELLLVVEAMKMEHRIVAPFAGTVTALHFAEGDRVDRDELLLDLEPDED